MVDPHQAEKLWQEAYDLFCGDKRKGHVKAIEIASLLIKDGPIDAVTKSRLQCFIADNYSQKLGQHDKAIEYYEEALRTDPGNSLAGSNLGCVYLMEKKDYESAARILQQTLNRGIESVFVRESTRDWLAEAKQKIGR
ncbi:MAG: tetratricopeptide repeat protein [Chloroflexi bacterium]|nr:tetratricopeptide repeat protein [Chloroflexota bacterium]